MPYFLSGFVGILFIALRLKHSSIQRMLSNYKLDFITNIKVWNMPNDGQALYSNVGPDFHSNNTKLAMHYSFHTTIDHKLTHLADYVVL